MTAPTSPPPIMDYSAAVRLHQAGQLTEAAEAYRAILAAQPEHAGALYLLGVVHHQQGD